MASDTRNGSSTAGASGAGLTIGGTSSNDSLERLLPITAGHGKKMPGMSSTQLDGAGGPDMLSQDRLGRLQDLSIQEESVPG